MQAPRELPGRADGVDGLIALADVLGDKQVFDLIRRCRTIQNGNNPGGVTLSLLAQRMVTAEQEASGDTWTVARSRVARRLGYTYTSRTNSEYPNFIKVLAGPDDGGPPDDELLELARRYGDAAVFDLIRLCRVANNEDKDAGKQALHVLANRLVMQHGAGPGAVLAAALELGYTGPGHGNSWTNFRKIVKGDRRNPDNRPTGRRRGAR